MSAIKLPVWTRDGSGVFVVDIFRQLGYEPIKDDTWVVGKTIEKLYVNEVGDRPHKVLHRKTNTTGNHCMAVYPPAWRDKIAALVRSVAGTASQQGRLF